MTPGSRPGGIYISYRDDDAPGYARMLYDRMVEVFGPAQVRASTPVTPPPATPSTPGTPPVPVSYQIQQTVASCEILLVVIGRGWLSTTGPAGWRRIDDPDDPARVEISAAVRQNMVVMPVLVQGAALPRPDDLPADIRNLVRHGGVELADSRWAQDLGGLSSLVYSSIRDARATNPYHAAPLPAPPPVMAATLVPPQAAPTGPLPPAGAFPAAGALPPAGTAGYGYPTRTPPLSPTFPTFPTSPVFPASPAFPPPQAPRVPPRPGGGRRWAVIAGIAAAVLAMITTIAVVTVIAGDDGSARPAAGSSLTPSPGPSPAPQVDPPPISTSTSPLPHIYPREFEREYLQSCVEGKPAREEYCRCTLDKIEEKYTFSEFFDLTARLDRNDGEARRELLRTVVDCVDRLPADDATPS